MSAPFVALLRRIFARFSVRRDGGAGQAAAPADDGVPAWIGCESAHPHLQGALRPAERS